MPSSTFHPFYYLDHFNEVISFFEQHCRDFLGAEELRYLREFRSLERRAQGL